MDTTNTVRKDSAKGAPATDTESLLDMEKADAAKQMLKDWDDSWKPMKQRIEEWKVNRARTQGYIGVYLVKKQDHAQAYIPTGAKRSVAGMNKAARLTRRTRAVLFADPPKAEAMPSTDDDHDRDAAEMSTRVLDDLCSEGNLAYTLHAGDCFDLGGIYGSGFLRFWVDETAGGWRPKEVQASPTAVDANDPNPIDPETGHSKPVSLISRFVTEDGQFTEDAAQAAKVWLPRLRDEVLTGKQVRFLPHDVRDLWECDGVMIGTAVTLEELERIIPEIKDWADDRRGKLVGARPQHFKDILEPHQKDGGGQQAEAHALVFVCTRYHVQSPLYPYGAYLIAAGEDEILHRSTWYDEAHAVPLDIPLTQFKQFTEEGNPYGFGMMQNLGPGNEARGALLSSMFEHLRRFQNRKVFTPITSPYQPQQNQLPTGTFIPILPGQKPEYEQLPDFPVIVEKMLQTVSSDMDDESGLQQAGQAINPQGVTAGKHLSTLLEQVQVGLSDLKQNTERALIRGWRIMLQLVRAYYTTEQQITWVGDDGRYKQRAWSSADLGSTHEVRLAKGSFTSLRPEAKAQAAEMFKEQGLLSPQELQHVIETNVGGVFGMQDNPHRLRVRRQIALWTEGPHGMAEAPPQAPGAPGPMGPAPGMGQPPMGLPGAVQAPPPQPQGVMPPAPPGPGPQPPVPVGAVATGAPVGPPAPPPPPPNPYMSQLAVIFAPVPADTEPQNAALRMYEIGRAMASTKFHRWDAQWQEGIVLAYQQARQAAQMMDAEIIKAMQQKVQQLTQELTAAKAARATFGFKPTELDPMQTAAVMQHLGIPVPPSQGPAPGSLQHEQALKQIEVQGDVQRETVKARALVTREMLKAKAEESKQARDLVWQRLVGAKPKAGNGGAKPDAPRAYRVVRAEDGKIAGIESVPEPSTTVVTGGKT